MIASVLVPELTGEWRKTVVRVCSVRETHCLGTRGPGEAGLLL